MKKALRDRKIPFEIEAPASKHIERILDEADEYAATHSERMTHEEVFDKLKRRLNA